jgi:hypothetical protein
MSRRDAVVLASRTLAVLLTVWALEELSYLPETIQSFLRYVHPETVNAEHLSHYYLLRLGFMLTRLIGFSLIARWLYQGGPDIAELLLPSAIEDTTVSG